MAGFIFYYFYSTTDMVHRPPTPKGLEPKICQRETTEEGGECLSALRPGSHCKGHLEKVHFKMWFEGGKRVCIAYIWYRQDQAWGVGEAKEKGV